MGVINNSLIVDFVVQGRDVGGGVLGADAGNVGTFLDELDVAEVDVLVARVVLVGGAQRDVVLELVRDREREVKQLRNFSAKI